MAKLFKGLFYLLSLCCIFIVGYALLQNSGGENLFQSTTQNIKAASLFSNNLSAHNLFSTVESKIEIDIKKGKLYLYPTQVVYATKINNTMRIVYKSASKEYRTAILSINLKDLLDKLRSTRNSADFIAEKSFLANLNCIERFQKELREEFRSKVTYDKHIIMEDAFKIKLTQKFDGSSLIDKINHRHFVETN
ncbi:hypothetical protein [Aureispira anguillae]|uniref:Uncharacterized protein n=1 Tax=Aureispira anguillae TaxID=2864201 RepID=A0A916DS54_9BACT|nr:hypothetical protein [Aureispira anguillae]BDS11661.1 hypothetical protein AsAng_0023750 [Aureispira anguillae]